MQRPGRYPPRRCFCALDLRGALLAQRVEISLLIADLLDRQNVDADAHLLQIDGGLVGHFLRERRPVGVDLLDGERAEDRPQVSLQRLEDDPLDLVRAHAEKALGRAAQRHVVARDLDVGDRLNGDRHTLLGVGALDLELDRHDVEREVFDLLQHGDSQRSAAPHHAEAQRGAGSFLVDEAVLAAVEDRHHRGRDLDVVACEERHGREQAQQPEQN